MKKKDKAKKPFKLKLVAEPWHKLNRPERKIFFSIMENFPATNPKTALGYAKQGGVKFHFIPK